MATPPQPQQQGAGPYNPYTAPVPQQGGGPAGPGYAGPQPYGAYGAYGTHPEPGRYGCRLCGAWPAAHATVRGHQGLIVLMRFLSLRGPFCRDCGLATYRRMSSDTLWQGWWGPLSAFITPVTLLMNLGPRAAFRGLAPPAGGYRPALDPGKPMWRRGPVLLFLAPVLLVLLGIPALIGIALLVGDSTPTLSVGQCVGDEWDGDRLKLHVRDCGSPGAEYRVSKRLETSGDRCAPLDRIAGPEYGPDGSTLTCLAPLPR
ncbi:hypothetical protein ACGFNX_23035 [Streptomyces sp. NPDC048723]|uniref:LppU/SCO3897 family protein n=1 Tax=unclassified Streptomyces TaxID=2593676 RepID=UPI0035621F14